MFSLSDFWPFRRQPEPVLKPLTAGDLQDQLRQAVCQGQDHLQERRAAQANEQALQRDRAEQVRRNEDLAHQDEALQKFAKIPEFVRWTVVEEPDLTVAVVFNLPEEQAPMFRKVAGNDSDFKRIGRSHLELIKDGHLKLTGAAKHFFELCRKAELEPCVVRSHRTYPCSAEHGDCNRTPENLVHIAIPLAKWMMNTGATV